MIDLSIWTARLSQNASISSIRTVHHVVQTNCQLSVVTPSRILRFSLGKDQDSRVLGRNCVNILGLRLKYTLKVIGSMENHRCTKPNH